MGVRVLAGLGARLLRRVVKRDVRKTREANRKSSRRFKTSRQKFKMYKSIWS